MFRCRWFLFLSLKDWDLTMARMFTALRHPLVGASFIEYLIIIGGIALVALVGFTQFSESS